MWYPIVISATALLFNLSSASNQTAINLDKKAFSPQPIVPELADAYIDQLRRIMNDGFKDLRREVAVISAQRGTVEIILSQLFNYHMILPQHVRSKGVPNQLILNKALSHWRPSPFEAQTREVSKDEAFAAFMETLDRFLDRFMPNIILQTREGRYYGLARLLKECNDSHAFYFAGLLDDDVTDCMYTAVTKFGSPEELPKWNQFFHDNYFYVSQFSPILKRPPFDVLSDQQYDVLVDALLDSSHLGWAASIKTGDSDYGDRFKSKEEAAHFANIVLTRFMKENERKDRKKDIMGMAKEVSKWPAQCLLISCLYPGGTFALVRDYLQRNRNSYGVRALMADLCKEQIIELKEALIADNELLRIVIEASEPAKQE